MDDDKPNAQCNAPPVDDIPDMYKTVGDWAKENNYEKVKECLESGTDPNLLLPKGWYLLHTACVLTNAEMVKLLLRHGANPHSGDVLSNNTPLHYAAHFGSVECCKILVEHGADIEARNKDAVAYISRIPIYTTGGRTPLMLASLRNEEEVVSYLLSKGADPLRIKDNDGRNSYVLACIRKNWDVAKLLNPTKNEHVHINEPEEVIVNIQKRIKLKSQFESAQYKTKITQIYKAKFPELFSLKEEFFDPEFLSAIKGNPEDLKRVISQPYLGIYKFRIFTSEFCDKLLQELEHFEKSLLENNVPVNRPNSMNNYGVILEDAGFGPMIMELMTKYLSPLTKIYFSHHFGDSLDRHHTFLVRYKQGEDLDLALHVDDSEVTLNVCLGKSFAGGTLNFYGIKGEPSATKEEFEFFHEKGIGILHSGKHWHEANKIESGERCNLILWCRSSKIRQ